MFEPQIPLNLSSTLDPKSASFLVSTMEPKLTGVTGRQQKRSSSPKMFLSMKSPPNHSLPPTGRTSCRIQLQHRRARRNAWLSLIQTHQRRSSIQHLMRPTLLPHLPCHLPPPLSLCSSLLSTIPPPILPSPSPIKAPDPPRRSDGIRRFPQHLYDFAAHLQLQDLPDIPEDSTKLLTFQHAILHPLWKSAMQAEMSSIHQNRTWSLVPLPPNKKAISSKWVYKVKPGTTGNPTRYKARLVARGFEQKDNIDFLEIFCSSCSLGNYSSAHRYCGSPQLAPPSAGCSYCIFEWSSKRRCLHVSTSRFCASRGRTSCL